MIQHLIVLLLTLDTNLQAKRFECYFVKKFDANTQNETLLRPLEKIDAEIARYLKGGGHKNFDAYFFVPMDSLGDAQVKNNTFE